MESILTILKVKPNIHPMFGSMLGAVIIGYGDVVYVLIYLVALE